MTKNNLDAPVTQRLFEQFKREQKKEHTEMLEAIISGMDEIAKNIQAENQAEHEKTRAQLAQLKEQNQTEHAHIQDGINGLTAELSTTPSRMEVEDIKRRLQRLEKAMVS